MNRAAGVMPFENPRRRRVARLLAAAAPGELRGCFVPLLDGGAAAVALLQRHPEAWFGLSSPDAGTVGVWQSVRDDVEGLIAGIRALAEANDASTFAELRDQPTEAVERMPPVARAVRVLYLRGAARPDSAGEAVRGLAEVEFGRDTVAYDPGGLRELARLLRARDVALSVRGLFEVLREVGEDDVVVLDPPVGAAEPRELRSFVGAVTAKGAGVLASDLGAGYYEGWPGMVRLPEQPDDVVIWGNTLLQRARAAGVDR